MKKLYISADIEGVTGVTHWEETERGGLGYAEACRQMTLEVAAACRAGQKMGYEVFVKDAHDSARNIDIQALPEGVILSRGWHSTPASMMAGVEDHCTCAAYIGYHSPGGTDYNPLAHTMSNSAYNWFKLNGEICSEFTLNSLLAAYYGVPSIFLSGDAGMCQLAQGEMPGMVTVATKEGIGNGTINRDPRQVIRDIEAGMEKALANVGKAPAMAPSYTLQINYKELSQARSASFYPGAKLVEGDPKTVEFTAKDFWDLIVARSFLSA